MIDEKDLEIARLKGQVEALERVIALMRPTPAVPAAAPPWELVPKYPAAQPFNLGPHGGSCACTMCVHPAMFGTVTVGPVTPWTSGGAAFAPDYLDPTLGIRTNCAANPLVGLQTWSVTAGVPFGSGGQNPNSGPFMGAGSSH